PPVGNWLLRSNTPMLSSPRKPPWNTLRPSASLRMTHQVKFSISLWNTRSRNARSPWHPRCLRSIWNTRHVAQACTGGHGDLAFLERVFHKLMLNYTWWVNRKDAEGRNVFQGGFLGLDNIGVFDRSSQLPTGGHIDQSAGNSWMAMYVLNFMRFALELAQHNRVYEDIATKFFEHFLHIAEAMSHVGGEDGGIGLWDDQDKFFYDV